MDNYPFNNIALPILVFPTKIPWSPPLVSPLIRLQEYKSSFHTEDDEVETLAWITQVLACAVRKAGATVASRSARFGQLQFRTFSTNSEAPLPSFYLIKRPVVRQIQRYWHTFGLQFPFTFSTTITSSPNYDSRFRVLISDFRRNIPSLSAISSEPLTLSKARDSCDYNGNL